MHLLLLFKIGWHHRFIILLLILMLKRQFLFPRYQKNCALLLNQNVTWEQRKNINLQQANSKIDVNFVQQAAICFWSRHKYRREHKVGININEDEPTFLVIHATYGDITKDSPMKFQPYYAKLYPRSNM